jgi:hypothetical protein
MMGSMISVVINLGHSLKLAQGREGKHETPFCDVLHQRFITEGIGVNLQYHTFYVTQWHT